MTEQQAEYGICRRGHLTNDGLCGIISYNTPCIQTDCPYWDAPAKAIAKTDIVDRLIRIAEERGKLTAKYEGTQLESWPLIHRALSEQIDGLRAQMLS